MQITCVGTAFNISPCGLWVTAKHVVDYATELIELNPKGALYLQWVEPEESGVLSDRESEKLGHLPQPLRRGAMIAVTHFTKDDPGNSDLALLRAGMLVDNKPREFPMVRLSARVPKPGTKILAQGYARFTVASDTTTDNLREIAFNHNFSVSTGQVLEVYPQGRDTLQDLDGNYTGKLPTVCFETSARFEPGMSGGPVMDEAGAICGIVATGVQSEDSASETSFASGTPFLYGLRISHSPGDLETRSNIYELV